MHLRWLAAAAAVLVLVAGGCGGDNPDADSGDRDLGGPDTGRDTSDDPREDAGPDADAVPDGGDGADGSDATGPAFTLALDPATLQVQQGQSGTLGVTLARTDGFAGPVELTLVDPPAGITGTFEPASATGESSQLTLEVGIDVPVATVPLTIRGVSGSVTREATLMLDVQAQDVVDVTVTVVNVLGLPVAGAMVAIGDPTAPQAADASGVVTFTQVTRPYDLYLIADTSMLFRQITSSVPRVCPLDIDAGLESSASVSGTVTGLPDPAPSGTITMVSPGGAGVHGAGTEAQGGNYTVNLAWSGPPSTTTSLHALALTSTDDPAAPTSYLGYATQTRTVSDQEALTGANLVLAPIESAMLGLDLDAPAGADRYFVAPIWLVNGASFPLAGLSGSTSYDVLVPVLEGATLSTVAAATIGSVSQSIMLLSDLEPGAARTTFALPDFVSVVSPAVGATDVPLDAPITWTATPGAVSGIQLRLPDLGSIIILSDQPTLDLATLQPANQRRWPADTPVPYQVINTGPFTSVNEAAQAGELLFSPTLALAAGGRYPGGGFTSSTGGSFRTVAAP